MVWQCWASNYCGVGCLAAITVVPVVALQAVPSQEFSGPSPFPLPISCCCPCQTPVIFDLILLLRTSYGVPLWRLLGTSVDAVERRES